MSNDKNILVLAIIFLLITISIAPILLNENKNSEIVNTKIQEKEPINFENEFIQDISIQTNLGEISINDNYEVPNYENLYNENENSMIKNKENYNFDGITENSKLGIDWLEAESISKIVNVPEVGNYHVYFDNNTLSDMNYLDRTAGLPKEAIEGINNAPNWLKDDLADKFGELASMDIDLDFNSKVAFADLDADGDYDMTAAGNIDGLFYYENKGTPYVPIWVEDNSMFSGLDIGMDTSPTLVDFDNDNDYDLFVGGAGGFINYYDNIGTPFNPIWNDSGVVNDITGVPIYVQGYASPALADMDGDGDIDLTLGSRENNLRYYENVNGEWVYEGGTYAGITLTGHLSPALVDLTDDPRIQGKYELVIGCTDGTLHYFEDIGNTTHVWEEDFSMFTRLGEKPIKADGMSAPAFADLNGDNLYDLFLGQYTGIIDHFKNKGTRRRAHFLNLNSGLLYNEETQNHMFVTVPSLALAEREIVQVRNSTAEDISRYSEQIYKFIFTLDIDYKDYIDIGDVSDELTTAFEDNNYQITKNSQVYFINEQKWEIKDFENLYVYIIEEIDNQLEVYIFQKQIADEIGFTIANTATSVLKSVDERIFEENARWIYQIDKDLDYVEIIEKNQGTEDYYSTLIYYVNESGIINEYELPMDIYYWYVVHPKITDESPDYIHPNTGDPAASEDGGRFWREYLYQYNDTVYPYDNADDEHEYPHDMDPPLLKEKLENIEFLWYGETSSTSRGHSNSGLDNRRWFDARYRILYANMTDSGWVKRWLGLNTGRDNDENSLDRQDVMEPSVIKMAPLDYEMWYTGYEGETYRILHATSNNFDGRYWSRQGLAVDIGVGLDKDNVEVRQPSVIYDINDNEYKMWYAGYDGKNYRILYATSDNGNNWVKKGVALDLGEKEDYDSIHVMEPMVIKEIDGYKMWYTGFDGNHYRILYATSLFGGEWEKKGLAVDYNQSQFGYDNIGVTGASVIVEEFDEDYKMWYTGIGENVSRILSATSNNGRTWNYEGLELDVGTSGKFGTYGRFDYPEAISPTVIKDVVDLNVTYKMWYTGLDDFHDQALEQVSNWVAKTLPLNQQEVDDSERPIQPVRIAHHHNGNCGELQDLGTSAGRTALIPSVGAHDLAEDHVWMQFWDRGWHQWDTFWSDSATITDDFDQYKYGWGKDVSAVWLHRGDDHIFDATRSYIHPEDIATVNVKVIDRQGNPVDGARVIFGSHWLSENGQQSIEYGGQEYYVAGAPFLSFWNYTDTKGECVFYLGENSYSVDVMSQFGSHGEYKLTLNNGGQRLEKGTTYNFEYRLDGLVPRPNNPQSNLVNFEEGKDYKIEIDYKIKNGEQRVPNLLEGNYHQQNIPTNNDIDFFICDESNYQQYLKGYLNFDCIKILNDSKSGHLEFILPKGNDRWYIIFSNTQSTKTEKVLDFEIIKYVRDFSINIEKPFNDDLFEIGKTINVSGTTDEIVTLMEINIDNDDKWIEISEINGEDWFYLLNTKNLIAGTHLIKIRASAGDSRFKYDLVYVNLWAITIQTPNDDSIFDIGDIVDFNGDTTEYIELDRVELGLNGNFIIVDYIQETNKWSYKFDTSSTLPDYYYVEARAYYNGLIDNVTIEIEIRDQSFPTVSIDKPENGDKIGGNALIDISGTATDNTGIKSVEVKIDNRGWTDAEYHTSSEEWFYEWNTNGFSIGEHEIYAQSVDNYGHTSQQAIITVEIFDDVKPEINIELPQNGKEFGIGKTIELIGTAEDNDAIDKVEIKIGENSELANYDSNNDEWRFYWDTTELDLGEYEITAKAIDKAENFHTDSITIKLIDKTPPIIKIYDILDNISISLGEITTLSGSVQDNIETTKVEININETWSDANINEDTWSYKWNTTNLSLGKFKIYAKAYDAKNNSNVSQTINIHLIDNSPPLITFYPLEDSYGVDEIIKIKGKAVDNTGIRRIKIRAGIQTRNANYNPEKEEWSYDWDTNNLLPKTYSIEVTAIDDYDNEEKISTSVKLLDRTPPEIQINKPKNNEKFDIGETVEIEGTIKDDMGIDFIEITYDFESWDAVKLNGDNWEYDWDTSDMDPGKYNVTIRGTDTTGNKNNVTVKIVLEGKEKDDKSNGLPIALGIVAVIVIFVLFIKFKTSGSSESKYNDDENRRTRRPPPNMSN